MKEIQNKYPILDSLLSAYFNPDWDLDYESTSSAVRQFIRDCNKKEAKQAIAEISSLLKAVINDTDLANIIYHEFESYCYAEEDGQTPRQWLEKVKKQIEDEIHLARDD